MEQKYLSPSNKILTYLFVEENKKERKKELVKLGRKSHWWAEKKESGPCRVNAFCDGSARPRALIGKNCAPGQINCVLCYAVPSEVKMWHARLLQFRLGRTARFREGQSASGCQPVFLRAHEFLNRKESHRVVAILCFYTCAIVCQGRSRFFYKK